MFVQAKELTEGMLIDLEPVIDRLFQDDKLTEDEYNDYIISAENEYAEIDAVTFEDGVDGQCVVIYSVNGGNWCVGYDWLIEVVG